MSFCYETVFSHASKIEMLQTAIDANYKVILICIHIDETLNVLRVEQRVSEGGHPVDPEKIVSRIPRTLNNIRQATRIADECLFYDNSSREYRFRLLAQKKGEEVKYFADQIPMWLKDILS